MWFLLLPVGYGCWSITGEFWCIFFFVFVVDIFTHQIWFGWSCGTRRWEEWCIQGFVGEGVVVRCVDNIKMEVGWRGRVVDWICVAHGGEKWRIFLWAREWTFGFCKMRGISWLADKPSASDLGFVELVDVTDSLLSVAKFQFRYQKRLKDGRNVLRQIRAVRLV